MNPLASAPIGRSFFSLAGERPGLGSTGQLPGGSQPLLLRERWRIAAQRRQVDKRSSGLSGACVFREIFYFANPGGSGFR
jgi:hypothetical protein